MGSVVVGPNRARWRGSKPNAERLVARVRKAVRAPVGLGLLCGLYWTAAELAHADPPRRIVSLDLCTDQLLIELAPRARIAAVTHLAADASVSAIPDKAKGIPITHGDAEDVLGYDPDLVLAGPFGVSATVALLSRLNRNVVIVPLPQDLKGMRASILAVAVAIGEVASGEAMLQAFDQRLAFLRRPLDEASPTALVYQVGGVVSAAGSLADAVLAAAGFRNLAREYPLTRNGQVPLELLVVSPPDLLVLSSARNAYPTPAADNLRHPALSKLRRTHAALELPWQRWLCGTPHIADAIEELATARDRLKATGR
jgi:iron complex transport system substrate-binding protein